MQRFIALFFVVTYAFCFYACGSQGDNSNSTATTTKSTNPNKLEAKAEEGKELSPEEVQVLLKDMDASNPTEAQKEAIRQRNKRRDPYTGYDIRAKEAARQLCNCNNIKRRTDKDSCEIIAKEYYDKAIARLPESARSTFTEKYNAAVADCKK